MDNNIVDFGKLKDKVRDKDINSFENYIYDLYYKMAEGKMSMMQLSVEISTYMQENNISQEKLINIQKEMLAKYGMSMDDVSEQMANMDPSTFKNMGVDPKMFKNANVQESYEELRQVMGFEEKYKARIAKKSLTTYKIKNSINDIEIQLDGNTVFIKSIKDISLSDNELNEFLCSYKKTLKDDTINIELCGNIQNYIY
ncbi:DUF3867 family protein [uncultured Clostridium sp.]|jgi:hypothetical protein|uniref:DUF3867 family protein n=1 Tax=uncultured Clostridium sp. TaxID=59620 RepID=UPI002611A99C|nr:DUF3867 family protein [uncultured Clostridium sp.]